jgi:hypothetical protein
MVNFSVVHSRGRLPMTSASERTRRKTGISSERTNERLPCEWQGDENGFVLVEVKDRGDKEAKRMERSHLGKGEI